MKNLKYYRENADENYNTTPISVLKYITELEKYNDELLIALKEMLLIDNLDELRKHKTQMKAIYTINKAPEQP